MLKNVLLFFVFDVILTWQQRESQISNSPPFPQFPLVSKVASSPSITSLQPSASWVSTFKHSTVKPESRLLSSLGEDSRCQSCQTKHQWQKYLAQEWAPTISHSLSEPHEFYERYCQETLPPQRSAQLSSESVANFQKPKPKLCPYNNVSGNKQKRTSTDFLSRFLSITLSANLPIQPL